jgi:DsbC/DsbD-like thiol-disulfide interchange protein
MRFATIFAPRKWTAAATAILCAVGLICASRVSAQSFAATHAKVNLIAEDSSLQPGRTAWIGLLFDLEKGWHIYWVNPGDSGQPPKIQWQLPPGFRAGGIRWPVPMRLSTGTLVDYGYEGRVLLPLELQVPADYKPAAATTLAANVSYLICREVCIPAKATASLNIPMKGGTPSDANARRELFRTARERLPKPLPAGAKATVTDAGKNLVLSVDTGSQQAKAAFFPLEEEQIDNSAPQSVAGSARGVRITLKKSDQLTKPPAVLKGVVVLDSDHAFEIAAPIAGRR